MDPRMLSEMLSKWLKDVEEKSPEMLGVFVFVAVMACWFITRQVEKKKKIVS